MLKKLNFFLIVLFLYILLFEILLRSLIFFFTLNAKIFLYGINSNIILNLYSLKKREFYIIDTKISLNTKKKKLVEENKIWIFGGSTSNKGFCDSRNVAWVDFLQTNMKVENFSKNGIFTTNSLNILMSEMQTNSPPNMIFWTNKVNEVLFIKRNKLHLNNFYTYTNSIKKSIKNRLVSFFIFDELVLRIFDKAGINLRYEKSKLSKLDYINSSNNFYNNTEKAIEIAKNNGVKKFYIISAYNKNNLKNKESKFFDFYLQKVNSLISKYDFVTFINTKEYLKENQKKQNLLCDPMHHNLKGKEILANIVSQNVYKN